MVILARPVENGLHLRHDGFGQRHDVLGGRLCVVLAASAALHEQHVLGNVLGDGRTRQLGQLSQLGPRPGAAAARHVKPTTRRDGRIVRLVEQRLIHRPARPDQINHAAVLGASEQHLDLERHGPALVQHLMARHDRRCTQPDCLIDRELLLRGQLGVTRAPGLALRDGTQDGVVVVVVDAASLPILPGELLGTPRRLPRSLLCHLPARPRLELQRILDRIAPVLVLLPRTPPAPCRLRVLPDHRVVLAPHLGPRRELQTLMHVDEVPDRPPPVPFATLLVREDRRPPPLAVPHPRVVLKLPRRHVQLLHLHDRLDLLTHVAHAVHRMLIDPIEPLLPVADAAHHPLARLVERKVALQRDGVQQLADSWARDPKRSMHARRARLPRILRLVLCLSRIPRTLLPRHPPVVAPVHIVARRRPRHPPSPPSSRPPARIRLHPRHLRPLLRLLRRTLLRLMSRPLLLPVVRPVGQVDRRQRLRHAAQHHRHVRRHRVHLMMHLIVHHQVLKRRPRQQHRVRQPRKLLLHQLLHHVRGNIRVHLCQLLGKLRHVCPVLHQHVCRHGPRRRRHRHPSHRWGRRRGVRGHRSGRAVGRKADRHLTRGATGAESVGRVRGPLDPRATRILVIRPVRPDTRSALLVRVHNSLSSMAPSKSSLLGDKKHAAKCSKIDNSVREFSVRIRAPPAAVSPCTYVKSTLRGPRPPREEAAFFRR